MQLLGTLMPKYHTTPFKSVNRFMLPNAEACKAFWEEADIFSLAN